MGCCLLDITPYPFIFHRQLADIPVFQSLNIIVLQAGGITVLVSSPGHRTCEVFLHAYLQVVYYNCVKFHKNSISSLVGVALTMYMPPPFRESISWIISPFKFWTANIFLHAHLQVVYYKCVNFHKNPISRLGGVALTRYTTPLFVKV
jgi:hypothetical protein